MGHTCCTPPCVRIARYHRISLFAIALISVIFAALFSTYQESQVVSDLELRLGELSISLEDSLVTHLQTRRYDRIARIVSKLQAKKQLNALVICGETAVGFPRGSNWESLCGSERARAAASGKGTLWSSTDLRVRYLYHAAPMLEYNRARQKPVLLLVQDLSSLQGIWLITFLKALAWSLGAGILLLVFITFQMQRSMRLYASVFHHMIRAALSGRRPRLPTRALADSLLNRKNDLAPLNQAINALAAKVLLFPERPYTKGRDSSWLTSLRQQMGGRRLIILANREPYIHERKNDQIEIVRPASGLVSALEPILRQCGGLWIAHGSGNADKLMVNEQDEVRVPPEDPTYTLRRIWLTPQEEEGYYYGFSNEGLWPLCHLAHTRPIFRLSDWQNYISANRKFSEAIPISSLRDEGIVLVQDYHFALAPRMIRERAPKRRAPRVGLFWHIPWPNPEAFGICPWHPDLLRGMLGADLIGFHTQYHCNNFLESCNRYLEARVDMETFSVTMGDHQTSVRAFPIGIETSAINSLSDPQRETLKAEYGIHSEFVAIGVDRVDYTKGLIERLFGVERFLEKNPEYIGRFCLTQIGSPSRSNIPAYKALVQEINGQVARINARFSTTPQAQAAHPKYKPIVFLYKHHDWHEIQRFYQLGDICLVTSLHDGMNLVAKEYIWCQRPDRGALILSRFTGASRELSEAFLVNPYCIEEIADAILGAIVMPTEEKHRRMATMRRKVEDHNAYHWASDLIAALLPKGEKHVTRFKAHPM